MGSINGISFGGLASGLDTDSIIKSLLAVERRPIQLLESRKAGFKKQKTLLGDFKAKLDALFDAAKKLRLSSTLLEFDAATNDEDKYLSASATSGAVAGSYEIQIDSIAAARVRKSPGAADADTTTHGSGNMLFTIDGNTTLVSFGGATTLNEMASKINDANFGVSATVVNTGATTDPYRLVLTSKSEGTKADFTVVADTADGTFTSFVNSINNDDTRAASDAKIKLNGLDITRSSNTMTDVITGVTINLKGKHPSPPQETTTLTISTNTDKTAEKIQNFVEKYNEIVDFVTNQNKVTKNEGDGGEDDDSVSTNPLFGDLALRTVMRGLRDIAGSTFDTGNSAYSMLAQIGIDGDREGKLTFNRTEFDEALGKDETAIKNLFTDKVNGIAQRIYNSIDAWTDSVDGVIKTRTDGLDRRITDIDRQIRRGEERLEDYEQRLVLQYATLEQTLGRLQAQGSSLSSLFQ